MQGVMKLRLRKNEMMPTIPYIPKVIYHIWLSCAPPKKGRVDEDSEKLHRGVFTKATNLSYIYRLPDFE